VTTAAPERALEQALDLAERGQTAQARERLRALTATHPAYGEAWRVLGALALQEGEPEPAQAALQRAQALLPRSSTLLCNLAALARLRGHPDQAMTLYREAIGLDPACLPAHNNLGALLAAAGQPAAAAASYQAALDHAPGYAPARSNLAACLLALDRGREALAEAERACADAPAYPPAWLAQGQAQLALGRHDAARAALVRAIELGQPGADPRYALAQALDELGQWPQALDLAGQALALDPGHVPALSLAQYLRRRLCRHDDLADGRVRLLAALAAERDGVAPFAFLSEEADAQAQLRAARLAAQAAQRRLAPLLAAVAQIPATPASADDATVAAAATGAATAPIRVGLVSSGFGQHPTALLIVDLVERLRGGALALYGYATTPDDGGPLRQRLAAGFAELVDLSGLNHEAMARRIAADAPQVLVDLRGWGGGSVADVFARRPAPVQVNWLAYPGTSGAPWIDYLLADRFVVPDGQRRHYSEALVRLPHCFQPSDSTRVVGEPPSRSALGLPETAVVLACFNNSYKYSPASLARFWRVLAAQPDAVLWLLDGKLPDIGASLRAHARAAGIDPARLQLAPKQPHAAYLASYRHADLFLDTTPYNAHTTASDALWAGCPVLTVPGETFAARVAGSLNATLGLDELNARDDDDFVDRAVALAGDRAGLAALRARLADARARSPLFAMDRFARDFTAAITAMVQRRRAGLAPADFDLDPSTP
jgi:predicted O-linked N-acetylglucosamine transferase (SPINDLY family)